MSMVSRRCSSGAKTIVQHVLHSQRINIPPLKCTATVTRALSTALFTNLHPSCRHPPHTRSRFAITHENRPQLAAPCSDKEIVQYFEILLPPLKFPTETALRIVHHASWRGGNEGSNNRLAFIGRRVLKAYLMTFLHAHTTLTPTPPLTQPPTDPSPEMRISHLPTPDPVLSQDFDEIIDKVIDARVLGDMVGTVWQLERVMRWVPGHRDADLGLHKVRGTTVEAVVGGVFHQFGGVVAHRLFHTRFLPHVSSHLPGDYRRAVQDACSRLGGPSAPLIVTQQNRAHSSVRVSASG